MMIRVKIVYFEPHRIFMHIDIIPNLLSALMLHVRRRRLLNRWRTEENRSHHRIPPIVMITGGILLRVIMVLMTVLSVINLRRRLWLRRWWRRKRELWSWYEVVVSVAVLVVRWLLWRIGVIIRRRRRRVVVVAAVVVVSSAIAKGDPHRWRKRRSETERRRRKKRDLERKVRSKIFFDAFDFLFFFLYRGKIHLLLNSVLISIARFTAIFYVNASDIFTSFFI